MNEHDQLLADGWRWAHGVYVRADQERGKVKIMRRSGANFTTWHFFEDEARTLVMTLQEALGELESSEGVVITTRDRHGNIVSRRTE